MNNYLQVRQEAFYVTWSFTYKIKNEQQAKYLSCFLWP